jgi:hypothetical protein
MIVGGSAALDLAGFNKAAHTLAGQTSVIILYGGNIDHDSIAKVGCRFDTASMEWSTDEMTSCPFQMAMFTLILNCIYLITMTQRLAERV